MLSSIAKVFIQHTHKVNSASFITNLVQLINQKQTADTVLVIGTNQTKIYANSAILGCQSKYYAAAFSNHWQQTQNSHKEDPHIKYILNHPEFEDAEIFTVVLTFMYSGRAEVADHLISGVLELADFLCITELVLECEKGLNYSNSLDLFKVSQKINKISFSRACLGYITEEWQTFAGDSKEMLSLSNENIVTILSLCNLPDIEKWNMLIDWATSVSNVEHGIDTDIANFYDVVLTVLYELRKNLHVFQV
jgi:hypothetical protein